MYKFLSVLAVLISTGVMAEEAIIEIIPVYNRPASEIQPLLSPLLETMDQVRADGSNLLVKTTPERLAAIQNLVKQLDTRQSNLLITVVQSRQTTAAELNAALQARIAIDNNRPLDSPVEMRGHIYQTQDQDANETRQVIRTLEGQQAYIKTGAVVPVQNTQIYQNGYGNIGINTTSQMQEATTGFMVTPQLSGRQVTLHIAPWSNNFTNQGYMDTQSAQTTLRVNLGEWIELGGANQASQYNNTGAPVTIRQTNDNQLHLLLKVDRVD